MAERALLEAVRAFLAASGLSPAPKGVSVLEPASLGDVPAVVLSLEASRRDGPGVGRRATTMSAPPGLPWRVALDLASPRLPEAPDVSLLSEDRRELVLPHGGLVRRDGSTGAITGADLECRVEDVLRPVVTGTPGADQVACDPVEGVLRCGAALPDTGRLELRYWLGRWEQELTRLSATLRVDVVASPASAASLLDQIVDRLVDGSARRAIPRLMAIEVASLSSVVADAIATAGRRTARFRIAFEHEHNTPESSGRVIRTITILSELPAAPT